MTTSPPKGEHDLEVCLVTQWFDPEPVHVPQWLAQALKRQSVEVSILTGIPNYPSGEVVAGYSSAQISDEIIDGLRVRRTPLYASHDQSAAKRITNYLSWAATSTLFGQRPLRRADAALVYSSPATAALAAMFARWLWATPYVLMIEDLWPDSVYASGFLKTRRDMYVLRALLKRFVDATYRHAAHIVVVSPGVVEMLVARGVPRDKVTLIYNWADEDVFKPTLPDESVRSRLGIGADDFVLMYAGNLGPLQGLESVVEAFAMMRDAADRHLVFVGEGVSKSNLKAFVTREGLDHIHFIEGQDAVQMPGILAAADAQLVSLKDAPIFRATMPGKMQTCLASGLPVIVAAGGDVARVAIESSSGLTAIPGDPVSLVAAVSQMVEIGPQERREMGERALAWYQRNMAEDVGAGKLTQILRSAASTRSRSQRSQLTADGQDMPRPEWS